VREAAAFGFPAGFGAADPVAAVRAAAGLRFATGLAFAGFGAAPPAAGRAAAPPAARFVRADAAFASAVVFGAFPPAAASSAAAALAFRSTGGASPPAGARFALRRWGLVRGRPARTSSGRGPSSFGVMHPMIATPEPSRRPPVGRTPDDIG
jgi:hypothetical protein